MQGFLRIFTNLRMLAIKLLALSFLLLFASCSTHVSKKKHQQLNINIPSDPATLDPRKGGDTISSIFHYLLFDGLVRCNGEGKVEFALAESCEISEDRKVYTFHLRDALWSDGSPITAIDFEKSWKKILDPSFPAVNAHLLYPIKNAENAKKGIFSLSTVGIETKDEKTLVVTLEQPTPYFLELISFCVFFPVNSKLDEKYKKWQHLKKHQFVCSGPFTIKKWKHGNEILLVKNKKYFRQNEITLDRIHALMINDPMTAFELYEKGKLDILGTLLTSLPTDALKGLQEQKMIQIRPLGATSFCAFNVQRFPFHNLNMRKAFAHALNREDIVRNITQLGEVVALDSIPPILKKQKTSPLFKDNNIAEAKKFLQKGLDELKIELKDLPEIPYLYAQIDQNHKIAQVIQEQMRNSLGVKLKLESVEKKILLDKLSKRDYFIAQTFWMAQYPDPMNILDRFKFKDNIKNYCGWENEKYIELLNESSLTKDPEERFKVLEKAEKLFIENMPVAPLFHWNFAFIVKPYVKQLEFAPIGNPMFEKILIDLKEKNSFLRK